MAKKKITRNSDKTKLKNLKEALQYLYYRFSEFYRKTEGERSAYNFTSFCLIWVFFTLHYATLLFFISATHLNKYVDNFISSFYNPENYSNYGKYILAIETGIVICTVIYFIILKGKTYQEIYNIYHKEPHSQRIKRGRWIVAYMVFSAILFAVSVYVMEQNRSEEWKKKHQKEEAIPKIRFKFPEKAKPIDSI